ncbi:MAG: class I SAM-dependent methyltransferase [Candidatus Thorarchaeota archaeon]|nr:class I SAM-dependent methyltransferase [Candidatus Thorarchaeota archaeon]
MSSLPFNWSKLQSADDMDVGRHFEYDSYAAEMFKKWLPVLPKNSKVLEVGSGSGFFTGKLYFLYPTAEITCLEPDPELREALCKKHPNKKILESPIESAGIFPETYDLAISHIVIHNLPDPMAALKQMRDAVKPGGFIACIEPTAGYRHILPQERISKAHDTLGEYSRIMSRKRVEVMNLGDRGNPYSWSYPEFFEELGLSNISSYGWCSVFTLSDSRFDFEHRKMWISRRKKLLLDVRDERTRVLVDAGMNLGRIEDAYEVILGYFETLENATEEELSHIHEQMIANRIITIGQKV